MTKKELLATLRWHSRMLAKKCKLQSRAQSLRDECHAEMAVCLDDPVTYGDPGDAYITVNGNDKNVLDVLYILDAIGIPGCTV